MILAFDLLPSGQKTADAALNFRSVFKAERRGTGGDSCLCLLLSGEQEFPSRFLSRNLLLSYWSYLGRVISPSCHKSCENGNRLRLIMTHSQARTHDRLQQNCSSVRKQVGGMHGCWLGNQQCLP